MNSVDELVIDGGERVVLDGDGTHPEGDSDSELHEELLSVLLDRRIMMEDVMFSNMTSS